MGGRREDTRGRHCRLLRDGHGEAVGDALEERSRGAPLGGERDTGQQTGPSSAPFFPKGGRGLRSGDQCCVTLTIGLPAHSAQACEDGVHAVSSPLLQVPCYVFDRELKKHDLNPLIKISGGYLVDDSDPDTSLFINVCRDIGESLAGHEGLVAEIT